jgi:membrane-bound lytic murein transglycosylase B
MKRVNFYLYVFLGAFALGIFILPAQTTLFAQTGTVVVDARRAELERQLANLEKQIEEQRKLVTNKQKDAVTLERDIAILNAQISKAKLEIRARDIAIQNLGGEITKKNQTITTLSQKMNREQQALAELLRKTRESDRVSLVQVALASESLSEVFSDVDNFSSIQESLQSSFEVIRQTKQLTEAEREALEEKQTAEMKLKQLQDLEKKRIEQNENQKKTVLKVTRGEEKKYQEILKSQEQTAAQIRAELFQFRGSAAIPFGQALDFANAASAKTGVRPAFILGILAEESNLGQNIGNGTWKVDMHPTRDAPIFKFITAELGLNPDTMPVSKKAWYGWGGAMGPSQFIPSTWACYGGFVNTTTGKCGKNPDGTWVGPWEYKADKDRIRSLVGKSSPANPWEPRDAIMATALLSKENGAAAGTAAAERLAALRYLAGWTNAKKPEYAFYGDDVMALAAKYQKQIDILKASE